ncbi:hypothetical protein LguiA_013149 [Lonicera macranthoides]
MAICTKYSFTNMIEFPQVQGKTLLSESNLFIPKQATTDQQKQVGAIRRKAQRHLIQRPSPYDREEPGNSKDALKRGLKSEQAQRPQEGNKPDKFSEKNIGKEKMTPSGPIPFASLHQREKTTGKLNANTTKSPETTSKDKQTQSPTKDRHSVNHEKRRKAKKTIDPSRVRPWRTTARHPVTEEQQAILTSLFSHICAGTRDPVPVRNVEKELNRLNHIISSISTDIIKLKEASTSTDIIKLKEGEYSLLPEVVNEEKSIDMIDKEAPVKKEFFQELVPSFFGLETRWKNLYNLMNAGLSWEKFLQAAFNEKSASNYKLAAKIVKSPPGGNQVVINDKIPESLFSELFNFGFIKKVIIKEDTSSMATLVHPSVSRFFKYLWNNRHYRTNFTNNKQMGVRIYSAPPLYKYTVWRTLQQFKEHKPEIYPSIHVLEEVQDCRKAEQPFHCINSPPRGRNLCERVHRLKHIEHVINDFSTHYCWSDNGGIQHRSLTAHNLSQLAIAFALGRKGPLLPLAADQEEGRPATTQQDKSPFSGNS